MPDRRLTVGCVDLNTEQPTRKIEQAGENPLEREMRPQLLVGVVEARFAKSFGPEQDVPVTQPVGQVGTRLPRELSQLVQFAGGGIVRCGSHLFEELLHGCDIWRHLRGQAQLREIVETQQLRLFESQREDPVDQIGVVQLATAGDRNIGAVQRLTKVSSGRVLQEGNQRRRVQCYAPGPRFCARPPVSFSLGSLSGERACACRQSGDLIGCGQLERERLRSIEYVIAKLCGPFGQLDLDRVEALFRHSLEPDTRKPCISDQHFDDSALARVEPSP